MLDEAVNSAAQMQLLRRTNISSNKRTIQMKRSAMLLLSIAAILPFAVTAALAKTPKFEVDMRILEGGEELSTPFLIVREGADASMSVSGENHLTVGLVVNAHNDEKVHVLAEVETSASQMSPELLMRKGEQATVSVGELELHIIVEDFSSNE